MKLFKHLTLATTFLLMTACATGTGSYNYIPMYGQPEIPRPYILKISDDAFINHVTAKIPDRKKASTLWTLEGDEYMREGDYDNAMRRYNQSWLLDPNNFQPYWGFGRVLLQRQQYDGAIKHFEKAKALVDDDFQKVALISDYGTVLSYSAINTSDKSTQNELYKKAESNFIESTTLDPTYDKSWSQWAFSLYQQGNYKESREKLNKAKSLGGSHPRLEKWLQSK